MIPYADPTTLVAVPAVQKMAGSTKLVRIRVRQS